MLSKLWNVFSYLALIVVCFIIIIFAFVLYQIPIPFVNQTIINTIKKVDPSLENKVSFSYVALGWNYNINRPVFIIKDFSYKDNNIDTKLLYIGIHINILDIIKGKSANKLFKVIFIDGGTVSLNIETKDDKINKNFKVNNTPSFLSDKSVKLDNKLENLSNDMSYNIGSNIYPHWYVNNLEIILNKDKQLVGTVAIDVAEIKDKDNHPHLKLDGKIICDLKECASINAEAGISELDNTIYINGSLLSNNVEYLKQVLLYTIPNLDINYLKLSDASQLKILFNTNVNDDGSLNKLSSKLRVNNIKLKTQNDWNLNIAALETSILYNKHSDNLSIKDLKVNFANNYRLVKKSEGLDIPLQSLKTNIDFNLKNGALNFSNTIVQIKDNKQIKGRLFIDNIFNNKVNYDVNANFINFTTNNLVDYWPEKLLPSAYTWMKKNINYDNNISDNSLHISFLEDSQFDGLFLSSVSGNINIDKAKLTYLPNSPLLYADKVNIVYQDDRVEINYNNLTTEGYNSFFSKAGKVSIYNQNTNKPNSIYKGRLKLDMHINGNIDEVLTYLSSEPLSIFKNNVLSPNWFKGNGEGKLLYDISLDDLTIKDLKADIKLKNTVYSREMKDNPITDGLLDLTLRNNDLKISGIGKFGSSIVNIDSDINWKNKDKIVANYLLGFKKANVNKMKALDIIPSIIWKYADTEGYADLDLNINMINKDANIKFKANLKDSNINIPALNYKKITNNNFFIEGNAYINSKFTAINNLSFRANDFRSLFDIRNTNGLLDIKINNFNLFDSSFKGNILVNNSAIEVNLLGSKVEITNLIKLVKESLGKEKNEEEILQADNYLNSNKEKDNYSAIDSSILYNTDNQRSVDINLNFDTIIANDKIAKKVKLLLSISGLEIDKIMLQGTFQKGLSSFISYYKDDNLLDMNIYNLGYALSFFDVYAGIKDGNLQGKAYIKYVKDEQTQKTYLESKGNLIVYDFTIGVQFASANIDFIGKNSFFIFKNIDLVGNFLAARYNGYLNANYLFLKGSLLPAYTTNTVFKNLPIVRDILRGLFSQDLNNSKGKEVFQINSNIKGYFGDIQYSFF